MGKYTVLTNPRIDEYIDNFLQAIVSGLLKDFPDIRSIIVSGSFGKGQGSVYLKDGEIRPQRDIDVVVVFHKNPSQDSFAITQKRLQNELCSMNCDADYYLMGNLIPEIGSTTLDSINSLPDIVTYDLKFCKVIYGEDIRPKIKWTLNDLPLRTNARAQFQKGIALIGAFKSQYLSTEVPEQLRASFIRETSRAYIEICVGLCLLARRYSWSCIERLETLRSIYSTEFHELQIRVPDLIERIEISTKYKLDPSHNEIKADPLNYWFKTRDDLGEVMKYYFKKYLNIDFKDWLQFSSSIQTQMTKEYYVPVVNAFLRNKALPVNILTSNIGNLSYNVKENVSYFFQNITKGQFSISIFKNTASPTIKAFSIVPLLLFSLDRDNRINPEYVKLALDKLSYIKAEPGLGVNFENEWMLARHKFLKLVFSTNMI